LGLTSNLLLFSALYVVDLKKFRETAAGDNLRVFYESLSKDPNSLSNLDQVGGLSSRCFFNVFFSFEFILLSLTIPVPHMLAISCFPLFIE
jgi:hypothetical protein